MLRYGMDQNLDTDSDHLRQSICMQILALISVRNPYTRQPNLYILRLFPDENYSNLRARWPPGLMRLYLQYVTVQNSRLKCCVTVNT